MARYIGAIFRSVGDFGRSYSPLRCRYFLDWSGSIERKRLSKLLVSGFETWGAFGPPSSPVLRSHGLWIGGRCICSGIYQNCSRKRASRIGDQPQCFRLLHATRGYCPASSIEVIFQPARPVGSTRSRSIDRPRTTREPSVRLQETG